MKVWDATSSPEARTIAASSAPCISVAFSPDGRGWCRRGADRALRLWEVPAGRLLATWTGHTKPVCDVAFSPDGTRVASAAGDWQETDQLGEVNLWDAATGQRPPRAPGPSRGRLERGVQPPTAGGWSRGAVSPTPLVRRSSSGTWPRARRCARFRTLTAGSDAVAYSPDGRRIAARSAGHPDLGCGDRGSSVRFEGHTTDI